MSRHKIVKNLDLDDELDDFDGGETYGYDEEDGEGLGEEDQEQMRQGTTKVRETLPSTAAHVTDKQIQEALWHYYYDVEKSVKYLVSTYGPTTPKVSKKTLAKKKQEGGLISFGYCWSFDESACNDAYKLAGVLCPGTELPGTCLKPFSFADFFQDTPWLQVPTARQTVFIDPIYPQGGLLGGSSDGAPKMSKLQALAAARKKKTQEQRGNGNSVGENSMASLDNNLGLGGAKETVLTRSALLQKPSTRAFPLRKRIGSHQDENPPRKGVAVDKAESNPPATLEDVPSIGQAEPSDFANTMFSSHSQTSQQPPTNLFTLSFATGITSTAANPFAGPSPDDIVIAAQSKAGKGGKAVPKTNGEKKADQIAAGVEEMKIDDTPMAKSKHLDVLAEFGKAKAKNAANFVVIGHVDAGKSTLMGRLLYDLNVIDQRTIDRYRKEAEKMGKSSFALAWVLDQGSEERARGVTIDIATNTFETSKTSFTILDAPGHRDFIPNMIAGASQADFAVLVIDANTGSFESGLKGQTREHALLVRSMGVQRIIIVVNKLDTVGWAEDRFTEISIQVSAFLIAAGFLSKNITFIPCSGLHGDNIARRSTEPAASWYQGSTLVEELDNSEPAGRALSKPLRLTIGDIFRGGVQNPLSISSRIESGSLQVGDALLVQPSSQKCFIKALEIDNEPVDWAVAGQNVTLHLSGIEEQYLKIGDVLCAPSNPVQNVKKFTAKVLAFEFLTPCQIDIHRGRLHAPGRITDIVAVLDKHTGAAVGKKKPRVVKPGLIARIVVELEAPVPLEAPSRVVLRSNGETVAAGLLE